jgi:branched-chain amino acid transport system ATP-binding protein
VTPVLEVRGLSKSFGAVQATGAVDLDVHEGEIHAVIGPNGAGKTTLIAQLAGELRPDAGSIRLDGREVGRLGVVQRARLGLARSFQHSSVLGPFSILENVALVGQRRAGSSFRFWRKAAGDPALDGAAMAILEQVGLADRAHLPAADVSHGERRLLELAMAMAAQPRLYLLDEPFAGIGPGDGQQMIAILRGLKARAGVLLVEHDMDAVFALADRITVLVYGRVLATGTPAAIQADEAVRSAYLGQDETG